MVYMAVKFRYQSTPTPDHKMKTVQILLLVAAVALLFLVGKDAETLTGLT